MRWHRASWVTPVVCAALLLSAGVASAASEGCQALVQAAATGAAAQMKADDALIHQPESVTKFTCLDSFFNGVGLDMLTSGLDVSSIAQSTMGKICSEVSSAWSSMEGSAECGLTLTGPDNNFDLGLGSGTVCPTLSFGGGGNTLINSGTNGSGTNTWDVDGSTQLPDGYSLGNAAQAFGLSGSN
ncbi:hypothetical protein [Acetobacter peroxydans]|uniref:Uncharacterized protein n=1 Tax=Acetobacter peroxydans TaxID=104098 RepID=A0A4Y3TXP1_9PROT|nr:hypothetical protein [Acetobacter peroxydans]NHO17080.1 hypothetical protein [Acetobacter peroxydans]GBR36719.1 hypothetical protein AA13755_1608 [Acetobacter peroxydans NBRC 13755]GBR39589.1 hypothetical protein AA0475_0258 [Acetobacter peroxydans]GEB86592.1 hypothetical protein APE01nite_23890 [Acetobacter peroxydans]